MLRFKLLNSRTTRTILPPLAFFSETAPDRNQFLLRFSFMKPKWLKIQFFENFLAYFQLILNGYKSFEKFLLLFFLFRNG